MEGSLKKLLIGACVWLGLIAPTIAQTVTQSQISGNEVWSAAQGPGGPSSWLWIRTVRGGTSILTTTVTGATTVGGILADGGNMVLTAQPSAAVITMPANPVPNGSVVKICNGTNTAFATNVVTVAANSGQTMVPTGAAVTLTTLAANTCVGYQFNLSNTSWYKVM